MYKNISTAQEYKKSSWKTNIFKWYLGSPQTCHTGIWSDKHVHSRFMECDVSSLKMIFFMCPWKFYLIKTDKVVFTLPFLFFLPPEESGANILLPQIPANRQMLGNTLFFKSASYLMWWHNFSYFPMKCGSKISPQRFHLPILEELFLMEAKKVWWLRH